MKYKLLIKEELSNHKVTCACGNCIPMITIDESAKEAYKELMNWSEDEFQRHTIIIDDEEREKQ